MERQCRLRCREGHLDIEEGDSRRSVFLEDLAAVVFASHEISVSVCLLDELAARGVTVVVCDKRKFPRASLVPMYGTGCAYKKGERTADMAERSVQIHAFGQSDLCLT